MEADFKAGDAADYKISSLSSNKFFIWPFISIQKDFGYSDATPKNNVKGRVKKIFNRSKEKIKLLKRVSSFYEMLNIKKDFGINSNSWENVIIPTYIINLPERTDRKEHIGIQFEGKREFDVRIVEACKNKIGAVGLWLSIRKVVSIAINNNDDVIIICEDDHEFTNNFSTKYLLENIINANNHYADLLSGGSAGFDTVVPVTGNLFWVNESYSTQFMVVYKNFFQKILDEPFNNKVVADGLFSEMTANKMLLYPFISVQKEFGYSDCTQSNNKQPGLVKNLFLQSSNRLAVFQRTYVKFHSQDSYLKPLK